MVDGEQFMCVKTGETINHDLYGDNMEVYDLTVNVSELPFTPGEPHGVNPKYLLGKVSMFFPQSHINYAARDPEVACPALLLRNRLNRIIRGESPKEPLTSLFSEPPRRVDFEECYEFTSALVDMVVEEHGPNVFRNVVELRVHTVEDWNKIRQYGTPNLKYLVIGTVKDHKRLHAVPSMTTLEIRFSSILSVKGALDDIFLKRIVVNESIFHVDRDYLMTKCKHLVCVDNRYTIDGTWRSVNRSMCALPIKDVAFSRVELITYRVVRAKGAPSSQTYNFSFKVYDRSRLFKVLTGGDSPTFRH